MSDRAPNSPLRLVNVLIRITPYMNIAKRRLLMSSFYTPQFNYGALIMVCLNNKINRLHERCLRIVYCDNRSSFEDLLDKDKSVSIYVKKCPGHSL